MKCALKCQNCSQGLAGLRGEQGPQGPLGAPGTPGTLVSAHPHLQALQIQIYAPRLLTGKFMRFCVLFQGKAGDDGKPGLPGKMVIHRIPSRKCVCVWFPSFLKSTVRKKLY